jgi:putative hemolysin
MVNIDASLKSRFPGLGSGSFRHLRPVLLRFLQFLLCERQVNTFLRQHSGLLGHDFIEQVLEAFRFTYRIPHLEIENVPASGRLVVVANHPLGALDALALLHALHRIRKDVRIVANDLLLQLPPLQEVLLPVDVLGANVLRSQANAIRDWLEQDGVVVIFPSGEVSRARPGGVRDTRWRSGFLQIARRSNAPILPVFLGGSNSPLFYGVSMINKALAGLLLPREMFAQRGRTLDIRIGRALALAEVAQRGLSRQACVDLIKRHVYRLGANRRPLFTSPPPVAHPESRQLLRAELNRGQRLGQTSDGKRIYLYDYRSNDVTLRELGRLRELSFRQVGEGSGRRRDLDAFDHAYRHVVLWDDRALEVAGAYRLGDAASMVKEQGLSGLYSQTCFAWNRSQAEELFASGLELGRSFVAPQFWGSRSLDYLWQGIGAFLSHNPKYRWLFGAVSISPHYPEEARLLLVYFYRRFYGGLTDIARARNPVDFTREQRRRFAALFVGNDPKENFPRLKAHLAAQGLAVPTLYKQYTELCEPGGVRFLDFSVDPNFGGCIDGLVCVDLAQIKPRKRERYFASAMNAQQGVCRDVA